jgi:predicted Zn-dependent protease
VSLELARRALEAAGGDAEAVVQSERSGFARFADSEVHQPTLVANTVVQLRIVVDGSRVGVASSNRTDDAGLAELAARAREIAESAAPDDAFPGLAEPAAPREVAGFDEETAALGPEEQARLAGAAIEARGGLDVYGFFTSGVSELAVASTTGIAVQQAMTDATVLTLAAGDGASGYATQTSWSVREIDPAAAAREAVAKAERTRDAGELEPGRYRAVLEPYAFAELLHYFGFATFNGLAFVEERSFLSGRLGERVFDPRISIADDALDPAGLPKAFDFEGTPKERVALVEDGVARGVVWDRATAAKADGQRSTGHALNASMRSYGPYALALSVAPGEAESTEELAELVGDGIYITRLHYLGIIQPRDGVITGMTRDGTFRIRDGKIREPLVNHRFTVSVPELLADVPGLTRETTLVNQSDFYDERYPYAARVPAIATATFNVTGAGSSPGL